MEEKIKISILYQLYGKLLTENQRQIINDYYNSDLSLSEIAENNNITRQAVRDIIKKSEKKLLLCEEKLMLMQKNTKQKEKIEQLVKKLSYLKKQENSIIQDNSMKKTNKTIDNIEKELKQLLNIYF